MPKISEAHFEARRNQILDATFRCLASKGYSRMTMRDIAAEAEISVGTLYLYFKDKDEMVHALSERARTETDADLQETIPDEGPFEILLSILRSLLRNLDDPQRREYLHVDLQLWAEALHHDSLRVLSLNALEQRIEQLSILLGEAQRAGRLPAEVDPEALARILLAILAGLELQKVMDPNFSVESVGRTLQLLLSAESDPEG